MARKLEQLKQYVGLDVSLKETSIAVIDAADKVVWRGSVASTPEAISAALAKHAPLAERIGLEAGQLRRGSITAWRLAVSP
jgi:transposase